MEERIKKEWRKKQNKKDSQTKKEWGILSPEVKQPGRDADHSLPFNAEVKNERSCTSFPHTS